MLIIKIDGKKSIDSALKNLKNKFIKTGISKDLLERKTFKKKSVIKRDTVKKARYLQQKKSREQDL
jgi:ribosomal protein S21